MRLWPRRTAAPRPQTYVGLWLRAGVLDQRELREQLRLTLNGGKAGWNYDEPAVVEMVFRIAARKLFPTDPDAQAITELVADMRSQIHSVAPPGQRETEALILAAFDDQKVNLTHIPASEVLQAHGAVVIMAKLRLGLDEAAIDQMIVEGERTAFEHGWHPPLARLRLVVMPVACPIARCFGESQGHSRASFGVSGLHPRTLR